MGLRDFFRSAPTEELEEFKAEFVPEQMPEYSEAFDETQIKALTDFGDPVTAVPGETFLEQSEFEHELLVTVADYLAEAFSRAEVQVFDENNVRVKEHPVELAYRNPKGGRGAFWRGTMMDWIETGLWLHGYDKTPGRRIYRAYRIPRRQVTVPLPQMRGSPVWLWTQPYSGFKRMYEHEVTFGAWRPDDSNGYDGKAPFYPAGLRNVLRRDKAASRYESDAYQRSGGQGLLFNSPTVAQIQTLKTEAERDAAFAELQETFEKRTTGKYRGSPIVVGDGTEVSTYGLRLRDMALEEVHARMAELILAVFQIPPASIGLRIGRDPTYANARVWEAVAFERGILPRQREIADRLSDSLLTNVERVDRRYRIAFKTDDEIRAKLEDRQILERMQIDRLTKGAAAVWEVRPHLEGLDPDPALEAQLQGAHMLRLTGASPRLTIDDPRLSAVLADAIELDSVAPLERLEGESATVRGLQLQGAIERLEREVEDREDE